MKKVLKNLGLDYEVIHACEYGCVLYYKENAHLESCPICDEARYTYVNGTSKIAKKKLRYFPITPRLKRLYSSPYIAKEMRWHGERRVVEGEGDLRHPADGEEWNNFNLKFPDFANEIRNVRLGLATDGFNPFGITSNSHSTWPIVLMPYNLPPSQCMKREFNMLALLISGPKSPGKCLNVFMRPLIDELSTLWSEGAPTYDCFTNTCFTMRAAVLWTISDFPGLGMLGGVQTKGYKACPVCLDNIDATRSCKRMCYKGHRRWLPQQHDWRKLDKYSREVELRDAPLPNTGIDILDEIRRHDFRVLSTHPQFKNKVTTEKLCWTHESIFYELPYWKFLSQPYSLDVMHIEKNVFDCVVGAILGFEGKRHLWDLPTGRPLYTVSPNDKVAILEMIKEVEYPSGYAGSLKSKINLGDKKFIGLKTHDCHVMFERLIPVFIRPYLPTFVVNPIVCLSLWFQRLCCRELTKVEVKKMKDDIVMILCHFERIFPSSFFTIMVHLMIHLPDQVLNKGPVHYNWMYPMERQLGDYKKYVRNTQFPEGCIAEQYIAQECVTFVKLYMSTKPAQEPLVDERRISVVSLHVKPYGYIEKKINSKCLRKSHWCVLDNCIEAQEVLNYHKEQFEDQYPTLGDDARIKHAIEFLHDSMIRLRGSQDFNDDLYALSCKPQAHNCYSQCEVNGTKFVTWDRDCRLKTQNSGVVVETEDEKYYGVLEEVLELLYPKGVVVVLFKCRWFNEDCRSIKRDHGLQSVDTSSSWFEDTPYCLASAAKQVFYIDDPRLGDNWKVINIVNQRGTYTDNSIARDNAYQEASPTHISQIPIETLHVDLSSLPRTPIDHNQPQSNFIEDDGSGEGDSDQYSVESQDDEASEDATDEVDEGDEDF